MHSSPTLNDHNLHIFYLPIFFVIYCVLYLYLLFGIFVVYLYLFFKHLILILNNCLVVLYLLFCVQLNSFNCVNECRVIHQRILCVNLLLRPFRSYFLSLISEWPENIYYPMSKIEKLRFKGSSIKNTKDLLKLNLHVLKCVFHYNSSLYSMESQSNTRVSPFDNGTTEQCHNLLNKKQYQIEL